MGFCESLFELVISLMIAQKIMLLSIVMMIEPQFSEKLNNRFKHFGFCKLAPATLQISSHPFVANHIIRH
jgi:hypothetical protein